MMVILTSLAFSLLGNGITADEPRPSEEEIASVEKRGREIAEYEKAAIRATDLLMEGKPDESRLGLFLAVKSENALRVYFGKVSEEDKKLIPAYVYSCPEGKYNEMKRVETPKELPEEIHQLARAIKLAMGSISNEIQHARYNNNAFREKDGSITVYITPGNTNPKVILLGGDFKFSISRDGNEVIEKLKLHQSTIELRSKPKGRKKPVATVHTHITDDLPTETDVAIVILNPQIAPHIVVGPTWVTGILSNGEIEVIGNTEELSNEDK